MARRRGLEALANAPPFAIASGAGLHGGRSTGAPKGRANGNYISGDFTAEAVEERQWLRSVVRTFGKLEQR